MPPCREANKQKYEMEGLNEKCEVLMEHSACSHVRDRAVNAQAAYANLYATVQGLLSRTEKSVADLTDLSRMRSEFDEWFRRANGTAQDAAHGRAKGAAIKDRVDQGHNSMGFFPLPGSGTQIHTVLLFGTLISSHFAHIGIFKILPN